MAGPHLKGGAWGKNSQGKRFQISKGLLSQVKGNPQTDDELQNAIQNVRAENNKAESERLKQRTRDRVESYQDKAEMRKNVNEAFEALKARRQDELSKRRREKAEAQTASFEKAKANQESKQRRKSEAKKSEGQKQTAKDKGKQKAKGFTPKKKASTPKAKVSSVLPKDRETLKSYQQQLDMLRENARTRSGVWKKQAEKGVKQMERKIKGLQQRKKNADKKKQEQGQLIDSLFD